MSRFNVDSFPWEELLKFTEKPGEVDTKLITLNGLNDLSKYVKKCKKSELTEIFTSIGLKISPSSKVKPMRENLERLVKNAMVR